MIGDGLMVVWLLSFAVYACLVRYVGTQVNPSFLMALVGVVSMASILVPGLLLGQGGAIAHAFDSPHVAGWSPARSCSGPTLVAPTAYTAAVRRLGVATATIGAEYTALAVGITASLVAHEPWTAVTVVAGLILCAALAVTFVPLPSAGRRCGSAAARPRRLAHVALSAHVDLRLGYGRVDRFLYQ